MGLPNEITTGLIGSSGYSGYQIDQSVLLDGSSDYFNITFAGDDGDTWTFSAWFKLDLVNDFSGIFGQAGRNDGLTWDNHNIKANDASVTRTTTRVFRDPGSWVHVYASNDGTRGRVFINGVEENSFNGAFNWTRINTAFNHYFCRNNLWGRLGGYCAEMHFCSLNEYEPTEFGEFYNGTTAWRPIKTSGLTYGNNGFYLDFSNAANLGEDKSGNGNDLTVNGSPVQSGDSPTVNYATWNPLSTDAVTLSEGNLLTNAPGYWSAVAATISLSKNSGKVFIQTLVGNRYGSYSGQGLVPSEVPITDAGPSLYYGPLDSTTTPNSGLGATFNDGDFGFYDTVGTTSYTFYEPDDTTVYSTNDLYCFHAFDFDNERYWVGTAFTTDSAVTWWGPSGKGADPTNPSTGLDISAYLAKFPDSQHWYFAHAPNNVSGSATARLDCGQNGYAFSGAKPEDYNDLSAANLPDPTITDGSKNFETTTWTGYTPTLYEQTRISSSTTINNSMVLDGSTDYLSRTPSSTGDRKKWTTSFWVKRHKLGEITYLFTCAAVSGNDGVAALYFNASDELVTYYDTSGSNPVGPVTTRKYRDVGSWYHIIWAVDAVNTVHRIWVNGVELTANASYYPPNFDYGMNYAGHTMTSGTQAWGPLQYADISIAEMHHTDGQYITDPTTFGEFNSDNIWSPKAVSGLTYGTNGFYLDFADASPNLGDDESGNGNDWTENGSPVQSSDSPTVNYATFNVVDIRQSGAIFSEGNLRVSTSTAAVQKTASTIAFDASGHYYAEFLVNATSGTNRESIGIINTANFGDNNNAGGYGANEYCIRLDDGNKYNNNSEVAYGDSYAATDVVGVRVDNGSLYFYKNGTIQNSGVPAYTGISGSCRFFVTIDDGGTNPDITARFNSTDWTIGTPPTGANDLSSANLPAISDSDLYFNGGSADLVWIKSRSAATSHKLIDTVRGVGLNLSSDSNAAETGEATVNRIDKYGIHLGDDADVNNAAATYVAWLWKAGGAGVVNTDGTISSTVSVNDDAGCSIVKWVGTGTAGTIGHGQTAAPEMIIAKCFVENSATGSGTIWPVYHKGVASDAETDYLRLQATNAAADLNTYWNDTAPTDSVFSVGTNVQINASVSGGTAEYIAYCFRSIPGYSKVFSYQSNNVSDGPFIWFGFKPAFVMLKRSNTTGDWPIIWASSDNVIGPHVTANESSAERTTDVIDFLSNGIKLRTGTGDYNGGTNDYIGLAFAETPFGGSNLPLGLAQ